MPEHAFEAITELNPGGAAAEALQAFLLGPLTTHPSQIPLQQHVAQSELVEQAIAAFNSWFEHLQRPVQHRVV